MHIPKGMSINMKDNKKPQEDENSINRLLSSIDNLLRDEKERKLRIKLGNKIKDSIFTDEIMTKLNESDFSGLIDEEEEIVFLFSMLFPVFVEDKGITFRLYRHKIEVDLSNEMRDRYIYIFSDGRLTSGLFESFRLYDDEYVYGIKRIINVIPLLKNAIKESLIDFEENGTCQREKIQHLKNKGITAEKNFNELSEMLRKNI
jgi:DNA-directed RNA polymerase beta subunit